MNRNLAITVLLGGWSKEREVSFESGKACAEALKKLGHRVALFDFQPDVKKFLDHLSVTKPDLVFNALHGSFGEDGAVQGLLEILGIPYTHSTIAASAIAMDKLRTKDILSPRGIGFAESLEVFNLGTSHPLPLPYVLKPVSEGSSIGVHIFSKGDAIPSAKLYNDGLPRLMAEAYIEGRELTISVLDGKALGVTEIIPQNKFYDYYEKYHAGLSGHICPADIDRELADSLMRQSEKAFQIIGCKTVCRCDFRYNPVLLPEKGIFMLEVNTHPGMTSVSLVPEQAREKNIDFETLVQMLVDGAF